MSECRDSNQPSQQFISMMTLKTKLSLILIPLVVLPIILLGKLSYDHVVKITTKTALGPMPVVLGQVHQELQFHLEMARATISHLSKSNQIKYLLIENKADRDSALLVHQEPLSVLFTSYMEVYPEYYDIQVLLSNGDEVMRFSRTQMNKIEMRRNSNIPYFAQIQQSTSPDLEVIFLSPSPTQVEPMFIIVKKIFFDNFLDNRENQVSATLRGYLVITIRPAFLSNHVGIGKISENGFLLVTDGRGQILYRPRHLTTANIPPSNFVEWLQRIQPGNLFLTDFNHTPMYVQGKQLHDNLYLFAILPETDVLAAGQWLRIVFAIGILGGLILTPILLFFVLNYLVIKPVQVLARASREIGAGNLEIQLPLRPDDEIGALYYCFNQMVKRLRAALTQIEQANSELEEKVRLRTLTLEQLNNELKVERQKADAANLAKSEFIANISHELRTPLNGILGMAELILNSPLRELQQRQLRLIYESGEMLLVIINDLLDVSKFEAGKMKLDLGPFNLLSAIEDAITLLRPKTAEKPLQLELRTSPQIPNQLIGDKNRLRQIILNLLSNSIKFTEHGSVTLEVKLERLAEDEADFKFAIIDTGIGIPADELPNLFNKFHQVDAKTNRKYGGTGLGLFICHQLVHLMHGKIGVQTELGKGSTFWFTLTLPVVIEETLPITEPLSVLEPIEEINIVETQAALEVKSTASPPKVQILLVEDDRINQMVAEMMLNELGCQISIANHGQEAIDLTAVHDYDLVFMDIHMPVLDGYTAVRRIRQSEINTGKRLLIIAMTANALASDRDKCLAEGMNDVLIKPVSKTALSKMMKKWLGNKFHPILKP